MHTICTALKQYKVRPLLNPLAVDTLFFPEISNHKGNSKETQSQRTLNTT